MKRILFFPNYLGGGFGHIGRCMALADEFTRRGGEAFFALDGPHMSRVEQSGYRCSRLQTPRMHSARSAAPAYVYVPSMAYQIVRDGFDHPTVVERTLGEALQIIDQVAPDILVGDGWPLTWLVAQKAKLPVVQLVKSVVNPASEEMIWWEPSPAGFISPDPCPVFNPVLRKYGFDPIARAEDLLRGDLLLIPSLPELDPMTVMPPNTVYVGPILRRREPARPIPDWMERLDTAIPVVYVSVGGAAGSGDGADFFDVVIEALGNSDNQVVISTGGKSFSARAKSLPPNIRLESWVPTADMLARSSAVVFHGGYTRMEILSHGLPSVVIPFHSEQEFYGRQMERAGVARCLSYSEAAYARKMVRWRGGGRFRLKRFSVHYRLRPDLTAAVLQQSVERILADQQMQKKAREMQALIQSCGGCSQGLDIITERLLNRMKQ